MRRNVGVAVAASLAFLLSFAGALSPIDVESQNFVDSSSGDRFEIIGVDYQPGGSSAYDPTSGVDALSDRDACIRDAAMMQAVGFNTIRTYNVDPDINHDECMSIFNAVGIYLILDVNSPLPGQSINIDAPASTYTKKYLQRIFKVVDAFSGYPNTIGFFSANELINTYPQASRNPPYIRAVTRDLKEYIAAQSSRKIPVGYSATDFRQVLVDTSNYVQCVAQGQPDSRSDFFALNSYSWCGPDSSFRISQYDVLARDFAAVTMPTFFSEYGCNDPEPRYFDEVPVLYGPRMTTLSGGLVYEWTQETDNYGLVKLEPSGSVKQLIDLNNLIGKYNTLDLKRLLSQNATARNLKPPTCSASLITNQHFSTDFQLPVAPAGTDDLIQKGAGGQKGKLIPVTKTAVDVVVTYYGGSTTRGLTITLVTTANLPGRTSTAAPVSNSGPSPSSSSGSSPPSTASHAAAPSIRAGNTAPYFGFSVVSLILWLLG